MKSIFTFLSVLLCFGVGNAIQPKHADIYPTVPKNNSVKTLIAKSNGEPHKTPASRAEAKWVDLGLCDYMEDIATSYFLVDPVKYQVKVQKDEANPGVYRIVDPWTNYPYREQVENDETSPGTFVLGEEAYIVIDASNPDYVRLLGSPIGMDDGGGESTVYSLTELVGEFVGANPLDQATADRSAGKLENNVISFPVQRSLAIYQGGSYWAANSSGSFALALPGGTLEANYFIQTEIVESFCPDDNMCYHINILGDTNIENIRYAVSEEYPEEIPDGFFENGKKCAVNDRVEINVSQFTGRAAYALFVTYDAKGTEKESTVATLDLPDTDNSSWKYFGKADLTEGLMSSIFPTIMTVHTYEVDIENNVDNPKYYRIVNPYSGNWDHKQYAVDHPHNHYIYINAEEDDNVYIEYSPLGVTVPGNGACAITSDYFDLLNEYGKEFLDWIDIKSGGSIKDNVLTFDGTGDIKILPRLYGKWVYVNLIPNPDYDEDAAKEAADNWENYDVPQYLGGQFKLDFSKAMSGIEDIAVENVSGPTEYYNLQGTKVAEPSNGVFIVKQGGKTYKKIIR